MLSVALTAFAYSASRSRFIACSSAENSYNITQYHNFTDYNIAHNMTNIIQYLQYHNISNITLHYTQKYYLKLN